MIRVQQLTELEEVIEYKLALEARHRPAESQLATSRIAFLKQLWASRLKGVQKNVEVRYERSNAPCTIKCPSNCFA